MDVRGRVSWSLRRAFVASARGAGGRTAPPRQSWHITRKKGLGRARKSVGLAVGNHPRGSVTLPIAYGFSASDLQSLSHRRSWGVRWVRDPSTRGAHPTALDTSQSTHTHTRQGARRSSTPPACSLSTRRTPCVARALEALKVRAPSVAAIAPGRGRSRATPQTSIRLHAPSRASTRPSHVTRIRRARARPRPVPRPFPPFRLDIRALSIHTGRSPLPNTSHQSPDGPRPRRVRFDSIRSSADVSYAVAVSPPSADVRPLRYHRARRAHRRVRSRPAHPLPRPRDSPPRLRAPLSRSPLAVASPFARLRRVTRLRPVPRRRVSARRSPWRWTSIRS